MDFNPNIRTRRTMVMDRKAIFESLRRLHGQNLENQGLNNLTEAFQTFMTRVKLLSVGKIRKTLSHSALDTVFYRRLNRMVANNTDVFEPGSSNINSPQILFPRNTHYFEEQSERHSPSNVSTTAKFRLNLNDLPEKVLERIFIFLGAIDRIRFERVSKKWLEAARKSWFVTKEIRFGGNSDLNSYFNYKNALKRRPLKELLRRCGPNLQVLDLSKIHVLFELENIIDDIVNYSPNLIELDISGIMLRNNSTFRSISENLVFLSKIACRNMNWLNDKSFVTLFRENGSRIRSVDFRGCTRMRGDCFKLFGAALEEVNLGGCHLISDAVINEVRLEFIHNGALMFCDQICHQIIREGEGRHQIDYMNEHNQKICDRSSGIKKLNIDNLGNLTDESLSLIYRHLNELNTLSICGNDLKFTSSGLKRIVRMASIKNISFAYNSLISDEHIIELTKNVPKLEKLSLSYAGSDSLITNNGLYHIEGLKFLVELNVSGLGALRNDVVHRIFSKCNKLRKIVMRSAIYVSDEGVCGINKLTEIRHIDLSGCLLVTNHSVQSLINFFGDKNVPILLVVGGTNCNPKQLRNKTRKIVIDCSDYSLIDLNSYKASVKENDESTAISDDELCLYSAHRTFISDALASTDEIIDRSSNIVEWAENEACGLGLLKSMVEK